MLKIVSNGSKWAGEQPDSIEQLIKVLEQYPLDPTFEKYGNFIVSNPNKIDHKYAGCTVFFGNFYSYSHFFNIVTDEPGIISRLTEAVKKNINSPEYVQVKKKYQSNLAAQDI